MDNTAYQEPVWEELIDGKVVAMSPRPTIHHNLIIGNIFTIFHRFLKGKKCIPFADGVDVYLSEKDRVIPDVLIVCNPEIVKKDAIYGAPDLIVEVLSPSTAKRDKGYKKDLYEQSGVKEYWIVDPENRSIEVYLLQNGRYKLDNVYSILPDYEIKRMKEEEIAEIPKEFRCSLYDDLTISVEDVFNRII